MANYINKEIICEAYTHLDVDDYYSPEIRGRLKIELMEYVIPRAKFIFGQDVELSVEFEDGSLKTKIAILGTIATLVSAYGGLRQGADQIVRDSTVLAQATNLEVIFKTKAKTCDRIRIEKRHGILGRVNSLVKTMDGLVVKVNQSDMPTSKSDLRVITSNIEDLKSWHADVERLFEKLDSSETKECIAAGLLMEAKKLPDRLLWEDQLDGNSLRASLVNSDLDQLSEVKAVAAKYSGVVKYIIEDLALKVENNSSSKV